MPKLRGLPLEAARAEMKRAGFTVDDNITLDYSDDPACGPNVVCVTYPPELGRVGIHSSKTVRVGRPGPGTQPATAGTSGAPASGSGSPASVAAEAPRPSPSPQPATPTPQPFF